MQLHNLHLTETAYYDKFTELLDAGKEGEEE